MGVPADGQLVVELTDGDVAGGDGAGARREGDLLGAPHDAELIHGVDGCHVAGRRFQAGRIHRRCHRAAIRMPLCHLARPGAAGRGGPGRKGDRDRVAIDLDVPARRTRRRPGEGRRRVDDRGHARGHLPDGLRRWAPQPDAVLCRDRDRHGKPGRHRFEGPKGARVSRRVTARRDVVGASSDGVPVSISSGRNIGADGRGAVIGRW